MMPNAPVRSTCMTITTIKPPICEEDLVISDSEDPEDPDSIDERYPISDLEDLEDPDDPNDRSHVVVLRSFKVLADHQ